MRLGSAASFARAASLAALLGAAFLLLRLAGDDRLASAWAARGFLAMALPGIVGGAFMARAHGRPGPGFVVAMGSAFVARLVLAGVAAFWAPRTGQGAIDGLVEGLAAGFVPVTALEMIWFARQARAAAIGTERNG